MSPQDHQIQHLVERIHFRWKKRKHWRQERELQQRGWYDLSFRSQTPAIFVGGCGRSGTTLFRELLNRHTRLFCGPETSIFSLPFNVRNVAWPWELPEESLQQDADALHHVVEFADRFFEKESAKRNKARWIDKTPRNVTVIDRLLTWYPKGLFIHLLRDGRDVVCSLRNHPRERYVNGRLVPSKIDRPIRECAQRWHDDTVSGLAYRDHPRCLEVRYEDLVLNTEDELRRVCSFLNEEFEPGMLDSADPDAIEMHAGRLMNNPNASASISSKSIGRWQRDLSPSERSEFIDVAGELLITLGYADDHSWTKQFHAKRTA